MNVNEGIRLFSLINKKRNFFIGVLGECAVSAAQPLLFAYALKSMAESILHGDLSIFTRASILLFAFFLFFIVFMPMASYLFQSTVQEVTFNTRMKLFSHLQKLPIEYYEQHHSGETLSRISNDIQATEQFFSRSIRQFIQIIFYGFSCGIGMFILDTRFAIILIVSGLTAVYINKKIAVPLRATSDSILKQMGILTEKLTDILSGIQVIKMFRTDNLTLSRYRKENAHLTQLMKKEGHLQAILESIDFFIGFVSFTGVVGIGMIMVNNGSIEYGKLLALVPLQMMIVHVFREIANTISQLQTSAAGAARLFELLGHPCEGEEERYLMSDIMSSDSMIKLTDITFSYDKRDKALHHFSLEVPEGKVVALVGSSGGGKSTVLKLLLGFYPPDSGNLSINGKSLGDYSLTDLRQLIAYVPQDSYLFEGTIEENIRYGNLSATKEEIYQAANSANAHHFIINLQDGYTTQVGEGGVKLSGGQRQRIAIARALLKKAPILLLDEATSSLDDESEYQIQKALKRLMEGKTSIVIAHRLSTIKNADQICVIEDGQLVEQGTHIELTKLEDGYYKRLLEQQPN